VANFIKLKLTILKNLKNMAKVYGPLHSDEVSGTIGKAVVHFSRKGQSIARQWMKPKNAKTPNQGDQRLIIGGAGRAASVVKVGSDFATMLSDMKLVKGVQTKQSYLVKEIVARYLTDATAFEALYTEFNAHTAKTDFTASAGDIGLYDLDIMYKGTAHLFSAGMMLYVLAKVAIALQFTGAPYTTALASWTVTQIDLLTAAVAA
jgi:hypothetical protein